MQQIAFYFTSVSLLSMNLTPSLFSSIFMRLCKSHTYTRSPITLPPNTTQIIINHNHTLLNSSMIHLPYPLILCLHKGQNFKSALEFKTSGTTSLWQLGHFIFLNFWIIADIIIYSFSISLGVNKSGRSCLMISLTVSSRCNFQL